MFQSVTGLADSSQPHPRPLNDPSPRSTPKRTPTPNVACHRSEPPRCRCGIHIPIDSSIFPLPARVIFSLRKTQKKGHVLFISLFYITVVSVFVSGFGFRPAWKAITTRIFWCWLDSWHQLLVSITKGLFAKRSLIKESISHQQ